MLGWIETGSTLCKKKQRSKNNIDQAIQWRTTEGRCGMGTKTTPGSEGEWGGRPRSPKKSYICIKHSDYRKTVGRGMVLFDRKKAKNLGCEIKLKRFSRLSFGSSSGRANILLVLVFPLLDFFDYFPYIFDYSMARGGGLCIYICHRNFVALVPPPFLGVNLFACILPFSLLEPFGCSLAFAQFFTPSV